MAPGAGLEPTNAESESAVLPIRLTRYVGEEFFTPLSLSDIIIS